MTGGVPVGTGTVGMATVGEATAARGAADSNFPAAAGCPIPPAPATSGIGDMDLLHRLTSRLATRPPAPAGAGEPRAGTVAVLAGQALGLRAV